MCTCMCTSAHLHMCTCRVRRTVRLGDEAPVAVEYAVAPEAVDVARGLENGAAVAAAGHVRDRGAAGRWWRRGRGGGVARHLEREGVASVLPPVSLVGARRVARGHGVGVAHVAGMAVRGDGPHTGVARVPQEERVHVSERGGGASVHGPSTVFGLACGGGKGGAGGEGG